MSSVDRNDFDGQAAGPRYDPQDGGFPWMRATFLALLGASTLLPLILMLSQQAGH